PSADARGHPGGSGRESLPVHRLLGHLPCDSEGVMLGSITHRTLLTPDNIREALRMLRDEARPTPMAGCTDLYVSLNFGTLREDRFVNLWRLEVLRRIELRGDLVSIGALATYRDLIGSSLVRKRLPMLAA